MHMCKNNAFADANISNDIENKLHDKTLHPYIITKKNGKHYKEVEVESTFSSWRSFFSSGVIVCAGISNLSQIQTPSNIIKSRIYGRKRIMRRKVKRGAVPIFAGSVLDLFVEQFVEFPGVFGRKIKPVNQLRIELVEGTAFSFNGGTIFGFC